ncbi:efflux RND transporter permease subunit [Teredinibacter sp. KSP-S5-2]|uniref:efflux RND transporter permease subunit n=1 Tax=Teredinibacter sp. KSP-S5-2 TaxID=3034506 RepID=UPI00293460FE|nr:efflux RND transporter permease subunit [Teredinibacter sp. KSP-S5-2]WNO09031.1 efflux RND transporter permease subunit [Teredinibacter sp. KSP-S5-2]
MEYLTRWFIHNPVAANLTMALIIIAGIFTAYSIRIEGFPKLPADTIVIDTSFPEAYAVQVDEHITQKIENALEGLQGVKEIRSISMDGLSSVSVRKDDGYDLQRLLDDLRVRMDSIGTLPREAEKPVIYRNEFDFPALYIQLWGETDATTLQRLSRSLREKLLALPEVSRLNLWGLYNPEIRIEITPETLQKYNISIQDLVEKIQASSLLFQAGTLKTRDGNILLRADSQAYFLRDFENIAILTDKDGAKIRLKDIATVVDDYEEDDIIVRFNGESSVGMEVLIGRKENLLEIASAVKASTAEFEQQLPEGVQLSVWGDSSDYISERLGLLQSNAIQGLFLVLIILALFLKVRLAFWVAMGIPISIAGAFTVMGTSWVDYSLNDVTTFGLIIALGILVDDAVVVGESIYQQRKIHTDGLIAAEKGVHRVAAATVFGVLTTVAAFLPMMFIDNALGKVMANFAGVVIFTLLFSLFESKFILPAHLAYMEEREDNAKNVLLKYWRMLQASTQNFLDKFIHRIYQPLLTVCLKHKYAVCILFISIATLGMGLMVKGKIKTVFFPDIPGQIIVVNLEMDSRAPYRLILDHAEKLESMAEEVNQYFQSNAVHKPIKHLLMVVNGPQSIQAYAELTPSIERKKLSITTLDVLNNWKERVGDLEGATELSFSGTEETAGGFELRLLTKHPEILDQASKKIVQSLEEMSGISSIRDSLKAGRPEVRLQLKPEAKHLGFTEESLAMQIGYRYGGAEAQRIQRETNEIRVIVKNAKEARNTLEDILNAKVKNDRQQWIPLSSVASFESYYSTDHVGRHNGKQVSRIQAYVDKSIVAPVDIKQSLEQTVIPELKQLYPDLEIKFGGELEQEGELQSGLVRAFVFTCILIYALLAIPLKSYWQPIIIVSVVPFGFVGAAIGHLIMGLPFSLLSFFGMLALMGIVVNDSLVLITRFNQEKAEGHELHAAIINTGVGRFKAIFLTTITTIAGLIPLMSETSEQAQYLIPAAVSLAFGELFATGITLILIPLLIAISEELGAVVLGQFNKNRGITSNN